VSQTHDDDGPRDGLATPRALLPGACVFSPTDKAAALRHQLGAPLLPDLAYTARGRRIGAPAAAPAPPTFLGQLTGQSPDLGVLEAIKEFGAALRNAEDHPLAGEPALVLYYGAIAAAVAARGARISTLSEGELVAGFRLAAAQPGAEALRPVFERAGALLEKDPPAAWRSR
jgi:hypothetical protein